MRKINFNDQNMNDYNYKDYIYIVVDLQSKKVMVLLIVFLTLRKIQAAN